MDNITITDMFTELNAICKETHSGYNFHFYKTAKDEINVVISIDSYDSYDNKFDLIIEKDSKDNYYIALETNCLTNTIASGDLDVINSYVKILTSYINVITSLIDR